MSDDHPHDDPADGTGAPPAPTPPDGVEPPDAGTGPADETSETPEDGAALDHPVNPRSMTILAVAVLAVAVLVIVAVLVLRPNPETPAAAPATAVPGNEVLRTEPSAAPTTTAVPATTTTIGVPSPPYEVAQAVGPGDVDVYRAVDAATPERTLPSSIVVGVEQTARVPLVMLVRSHPRDGWLEVYLPVRPNGSTGFIRSSTVTTITHNFRIEVELGAFRLQAYDGDTRILDAPIAVGGASTPTPGGLYYTTMLLQPPDQNGPYGTFAYGLSGYSDTLTAFAGGDGQLGIHGTNEPWLMGQTVSHGCIRLRNEDIDRVAAVLPLGVPVGVTP